MPELHLSEDEAKKVVIVGLERRQFQRLSKMSDCLRGLALIDCEVTEASVPVGTTLLIGFFSKSEEALPG